MRKRILLACSIGLFSLFPLASTAQDIHDNENCMFCHSDSELMGEINGEEVSMFIDGEAYENSIHGSFSCTDCHIDIEEVPHDAELEPVNCADCHFDAEETLAGSVHDLEEGPTCADCHGDAHKLLSSSNPDSMTHLFNVADSCGKCHSESAIMEPYNEDVLQREQLFRESVHAKELISGNEEAPSCSECHGYHAILPLRDPESKTYFMNVPETCGQCHETSKEHYLESIHGESAMYGHKDAPICTDCHGEHAIFRTEDERSPVSFFNISDNTCARCHSSLVINEKYSIQGGVVRNFNQSYHGLAIRGGSQRAANCASCHGTHLILPSSDPRSTVSPERLVETCGECHPGISTNVLAAPIHSEITVVSDVIQAWVPRIYLPLIVLVIGGMLIHNGIILWALMKEKFRRESREKSYTRFTTFEVWCHIILTVSFILLAITGFALISPDSWWVTGLSFLGFSEPIRSFLHRVGGVMLLGISLIYAIYMLGTRRGRQETWAFMLWPRDLVHAWQHLMYHLGRRSDPPEFDRYDYAEKLEFWALIWGVIIMGVTGLILWFPIVAFQYLPKWAIDIAELIHYYEAVLATLAIIVWHFFFVIFHPEEYPMSVTWLNGKMTVEQLKHRHPREYKRLKDRGLLPPEPEEGSETQPGEAH